MKSIVDFLKKYECKYAIIGWFALFYLIYCLFVWFADDTTNMIVIFIIFTAFLVKIDVVRKVICDAVDEKT